MREIIEKHIVYKYNELSDKAKEKVRKWYLDGQIPEVFEDMCNEDLNHLFRDSGLKVQFSLNCCQGDGLNIHGSVSAQELFECLENHRGGTQLQEFENILNEKEKRTILAYQEQCDEVELSRNYLYDYSLANRIDVSDEWFSQLEWAGYRNIDEEVLRKFERMVRGIFGKLSSKYEKDGYNYFYEVEESDLEEWCEQNEWEFYEDGTPYYN